MSKSCKGKPVDRYSIGHAFFGLAISSIMIAFSCNYLLSFTSCACYPTVKTTVMILSSMFALSIFITWEIIEHSFVKRKIYIGILKEKKWCETRENSTLDVVIAFIVFFGTYFPAIYFNLDYITITILIMLPWVTIPVVAYLVVGRR